MPWLQCTAQSAYLPHKITLLSHQVAVVNTKWDLLQDQEALQQGQGSWGKAVFHTPWNSFSHIVPSHCNFPTIESHQAWELIVNTARASLIAHFWLPYGAAKDLGSQTLRYGVQSLGSPLSFRLRVLDAVRMHKSYEAFREVGGLPCVQCDLRRSMLHRPFSTNGRISTLRALFSRQWLRRGPMDRRCTIALPRVTTDCCCTSFGNLALAPYSVFSFNAAEIACTGSTAQSLL